MAADTKEFTAKLKWLALMPVLLTPPYALTNRLHLFESHEVPRLAFDNAIAFMPELSGLYLSLFPFMWLSVLSQPTASEARKFILGGTACSCLASLIFLVYPTTFPRPNIDASGVYAWIVTSDTPYNACPSLHGSYAVYSAAWLAGATTYVFYKLFVMLVAMAIFYATIAVRQHGIIDLTLGGLLGYVTFLWARSLPDKKKAAQ